MTEKRIFYRGRLLMAFILTNLIFIAIIAFTNSVSYLNYQKTKSNTLLVDEYLKQMEKYFEESNCDNSLILSSSETLDIAGSRISLLETRFGKDDPRVIEQKTYYSELEIKHFETVKKLNSLCEANWTTILFFYSNNEPLDEESETIGIILDTFKRKNSEKVMVYSFDFDISHPPVNEIKEKYDIEKAPLILINEKDYLIPSNIEELNKFL